VAPAEPEFHFQDTQHKPSHCADKGRSAGVDCEEGHIYGKREHLSYSEVELFEREEEVLGGDERHYFDSKQ